MKQEMKALCIGAGNTVTPQTVLRPEHAAPGHLLIRMETCGINAGDKALIGGAFPPGSIPTSMHNIAGVSGTGTVLETGAGVPAVYLGKNVAVYRSLKFSESIIGTWSEYAHLHYLQCVVLPDAVTPAEYSASLVNIITPYAFLKQVSEEGHKGIVSTAGTSATGVAMLGICIAYNFPLISIVRTAQAKGELEALGAQHVLVQSDPDFKIRLKEISHVLAGTAIFDGVGGELLTTIMEVIPNGSTVYAYGYLGGKAPVTFHTSVLMRGITLRGFGNFRTNTVQDPARLETALTDISSIMHMPHFKTKLGKKFKFEAIDEALRFTDDAGGKAVLVPSE